jgi:hypothetical protein
MIEPEKHTIRLERGGTVINARPSVDAVMLLIQEMHSDSLLGQAPEMALEFDCENSSDRCEKIELRILFAYHQTSQPCWIVLYVPTKSTFSLLSKGSLSETRFEPWTVCGAVSFYRSDCLLNETELVRQAVVWFLDHQSACPFLEWIPYHSAVQDL